ncbi:TPA: hypothetical protein OVG04_002740 [Staphylococcus aureus]|uniref:hypothetical protein n=1 Tax=Staphylococcus warneri TaxID=1292 RepID=UPI00214B4E8E|nr:hypothetical protein [Staphylococcus warneri]MCR1798267.1 hypothetical protein [Staphylococcus warneri]HCU8763925.1 hypothetical protein [Staphylococcus aureus]
MQRQQRLAQSRQEREQKKPFKVFLHYLIWLSITIPMFIKSVIEVINQVLDLIERLH